MRCFSYEGNWEVFPESKMSAEKIRNTTLQSVDFSTKHFLVAGCIPSKVHSRNHKKRGSFEECLRNHEKGFFDFGASDKWLKKLQIPGGFLNIRFLIN